MTNHIKQDIVLLKTINAFKNVLYLPLLYPIYQSTICFFCDTDQGEQKAAGSGLLIKYGEDFYVVSAAHVLAEHLNDTYVILADEDFVIGGISQSSPMPASGNRDDDKIDISIIKVDHQSAVKLLTRFRPINTTNEIELNHMLIENHKYFTLGYPLTRSEKQWLTNNIRSIAYPYQSIPIMEYDYRHFGFNRDATIAIKYDGLVSSEVIPAPHLSPKFTGNSGCGLWYFNKANQRLLVGIVIEKRSERGYEGILATKIDLVIRMINDM